MSSRNYDLSQTPSDSILIFPDVPASPPSAGSFLGAVTSSLKLAQLGFFAPSAVYIPTAGGTMTGPLILNADPTVNLGAATKQYTDKMLPLAGGQMTGFFALAGDATQPLQPVTLQQLNAKLNIAGGTMTGNLFLNADPASNLQAATKRYADNQVNTVAANYLPLAGGILTGTLVDAGGDSFMAGDPRIPYVYYWTDPTQQIAGGIATNGTLSWTQAQINNLTATNATLATATIQGGTATLSTLTATTSITTPSLSVSSSLTFPGTLAISSLTVAGDGWAAMDPRISGYAYAFSDPTTAITGGILTDGTLSWSQIRAVTGTITGALNVGSLTFSGALTVPSLVVNDSTWNALDPRIPGLQYAWTDPTGAVAAGVGTDGTFQLSSATVQASLTLAFDATQPNHALRKSYADAAYIPTTGGTMTGALYLPVAWPSVPTQAASKDYVDHATGSGGGGTGTYPVPPMRDPMLGYGAVGDGVADDSSAVNAAVMAALAAGERLLAVNKPFNVPNLTQQSAGLIFVGSGAILNSVVWKWVIPPFAPTPAQRLQTTFNVRAHCPNFCTTVKSTGSAVVVMTGDSYGVPLSNGMTSQGVLWTRLRRTFDEANPGKQFTWYNRAIGGGTWQMLDTVHSSPAGVSWYTDPLRAWLLYVQDLNPDLVFINFASNDGTTFRYAQLLSVLAKMRAWSKVPDIVLVTSEPYAQQTASSIANAAAFMAGDHYCAGFERSYCLAHGMGLLDTFREIMLHRTGLDSEDIPLIRDTGPTGGYITAHANISLPYTWPTTCFGYGGNFFVFPGNWAGLGNEVQFELSPQTTNASHNAGNLLRVGLDTASGKIYYQVDTTLTSSGADQTDTFIPKTIVANWDGTGNTGFQFSVVGSQVIFGGSNDQDTYLTPFSGAVPRFGMPWAPKITCTAGAVSNKLTWGRANDGYALAMTANPTPRTLYMPTMTDYEAHGGTEIPQTSGWGGGGIGHSSTVNAVLAIQRVLDSCDLSVI